MTMSEPSDQDEPRFTDAERGLTRRGADNKGLIPQRPVLKTRCHRRTITVPPTYAEFEALIRRWIATCVLSRTKRRDGEPFRRENELVSTQNGTLTNVWNLIGDKVGSKVLVEANYDWVLFGRRWGVGGITFRTDVLEPLSTNVLHNPIPAIPDGPDQIPPQWQARLPPPRNDQEVIQRALSALRSAPKDWVIEPPWEGRMECMLRALRSEHIDDRFISGELFTKQRPRIGVRLPANEDDLEEHFTRRARQLLRTNTKNVNASELYASLGRLEEEIALPIRELRIAHERQQSGLGRRGTGMVLLKDWVSDQRNNWHSIYRCFRTV
jgi:hypothetical protein